MKAIHVNWTKVYEYRNPGNAYVVRDYELLTTILSALSWRQHNGSIQMVTDYIGQDYYRSLGLDSLWDLGITTELEQFRSLPIHPDYFWAAGKIMALSLQQAPVVMMDTDFIVWKHIDFSFFQDNFATIHREEISDVYPGMAYFNAKTTYSFPNDLNWNILPCNTAFTYIGNQQLLREYTKESLTFMTHTPNPDHYITYMVFAEQRLLPMCAERLGVRIYDFYDQEQLFSKQQNTFTHTWGYKSHLESNPEEQRDFSKQCVKRIKKEYPWFMDTLSQIQQLHSYL